ncbi:hypothetical protein LXA43DRAFT_1101236 [Ganoderma leucocontextum]|nr:hypothetical protein LXA43DRAFT_1101236 [Ganoderma leucocontextum]
MPNFDFDRALPLDGPPTFTDGLSASFDDRHSYLVTSPNADFVPEVVQGIVDVILRADGKYGPTDPIQWPQIFAPHYAYLATVPKRVDIDHHWAPIWRGPAPDDFAPLSGTPVSGFGLLCPSFLAPLRLLVSEMSQLVDEFVREVSPKECRDLRWHQIAMRHSLQRLSLMSATFPDQILQVAELQRHWLMAAGYLEYQRRVRSLLDIGGFTCSQLSLMGAWTSDPRSVQILFDAHVPVWFVRHSHLCHADIRIQHKTTPLKPTMVCAERFPSIDTPVFHGLVGESHLASMMQGGHGYRDISRVPTAAVYHLDEYGSAMSNREAKAATRS